MGFRDDNVGSLWVQLDDSLLPTSYDCPCCNKKLIAKALAFSSTQRQMP